MKVGQPIRRKITWPVLIVAVIMPLLALLVFNMGMRFYLAKAARDDLKTTAAVIDTLVRQQPSGEQSAGDGLSAAIRERLTYLRTAIRASRLVSTSDLLVISQDGKLLLPSDPATLGMNAATIQRVQKRVAGAIANQASAKQTSVKQTPTSQTQANQAPANQAPANQAPANQATTNQANASQATARQSTGVLSVWTRQGHFLFIGTPLFPNLPNRTPTLVILTRISLFEGFTLVINLLLIGLFLIGSAVSLLVAHKTASDIEKPLKSLNQFADRIGHGDFGNRIGTSDFSGDSRFEPCQELAMLTARMNEMADHLSQADHLQKTFLQHASHEIRTPLMAIQGYAEGLASGVITDVPKAAAVIRDESLRLSALTEKLLMLSRIENQAGQARLIRQNLADQVREMIGRMQPLAEKDHKALHLRVDREPVPVLLDDELIDQALINLLTNAIRYCSQSVDIHVLVDGEKALVRIMDDGPGLETQSLPLVFDRFYKGANGQFGLGLSIARSAVIALGGTITAENRTDRSGALFTIRLPLAPPTT